VTTSTQSTAPAYTPMDDLEQGHSVIIAAILAARLLTLAATAELCSAFSIRKNQSSRILDSNVPTPFAGIAPGKLRPLGK